MNLDLWNHEGWCSALYKLAGADEEEPPGPHALARLLGLPIRYAGPPELPASALVVLDGRHTVLLRSDLTSAAESWAIYHEIAEWALRGFRDVRQERACQALAGCLRMPRPAFMRTVARFGTDFSRLADAWGASLTGVALRYLETADRPGALVTSTTVRTRGPAWAWPPDAELRRAAAAPSGRWERYPLPRACVLLAA